MPKQRTRNSRQPRPSHAIHSNYFEQLLIICREQPARFRTVRPETKRQLSIYLLMKEQGA